MNSDKELERIKWEYLKRSEPYLEYCKLKKNPKLPIPDKFQTANIPMQDINPIVMTFFKYGNIHTTSFDNWYFGYFEDDKGGKQIPSKDIHLGSVDDLSGVDPSMRYFMRNTFVYIIERCKTIFGREPSLLEMADFLCSTMRMEREFQSYLKIKQQEYTIEEAKRLRDEVYEILKKRVPTGRTRYNELEKYLTVYDSRKKRLSDSEIINKIYKVDEHGNIEGKRTKDNKGEKEVTDEINKYYKYAERLIENAERDIYADKNIFPGEYWKN